MEKKAQRVPSSMIPWEQLLVVPLDYCSILFFQSSRDPSIESKAMLGLAMLILQTALASVDIMGFSGEAVSQLFFKGSYQKGIEGSCWWGAYCIESNNME
jgi:hypothetical protein